MNRGISYDDKSSEYNALDMVALVKVLKVTLT